MTILLIFPSSSLYINFVEHSICLYVSFGTKVRMCTGLSRTNRWKCKGFSFPRFFLCITFSQWMWMNYEIKVGRYDLICEWKSPSAYQDFYSSRKKSSSILRVNYSQKIGEKNLRQTFLLIFTSFPGFLSFSWSFSHYSPWKEVFSPKFCQKPL